MPKLLGVLAILLIGLLPASAQYQSNTGNGLYGTGSNPNSHYVAPHLNSNGSYVGGHQQTNPNNTQMDNYGTRGNINPYTGNVGTRSPYR